MGANASRASRCGAFTAWSFNISDRIAGAAERPAHLRLYVVGWCSAIPSAGGAVLAFDQIPSALLRPNVGWSRQWAVDTVPDVPSDEEDRRAYRVRLGANLGRIRSKLTPYTQESIADVLGMDAETYGRWERGTREPKAYDLHRLAEKFGVPAEWLLEPTDSISELDRRIGQLRRAAAEAARADEEEAQSPRAVGATDVRRGRR